MIRIGSILKTKFSALVIKGIIRTLYFALFIVALLGPSFGDTTREIKSIGKDIMICVDLSESMNATDIQPSRIEKIKFELKNLVNAFSSDRIGLVIFSSEAFMQCPLTYDQSALNLFIETLGTRLVPNTGTDFGPALEMALSKLQTDIEQTSPAEQKAKVIILISDGEDFGENTDEIVSEIEDSGIKLFALGVGTPSGSRILMGNGMYKTDRNGQEVISRINDKSLKNIAASTGGMYYEINNDKNDIERLINTIDGIEGELRDSKMVDVSANKYYYFIALALILITIDLIFRNKTVHI